MHELLQQYHEIIAHYEILEYEVENSNIRLKLVVTLVDQSRLFAREYVFEGERRKYSFQKRSHVISEELSVLISPSPIFSAAR